VSTTAEVTTSSSTVSTTPPSTSTTSPLPATPPCDEATLQAAWNSEHHQRGYPYVLENARCDDDVAVGFITSQMPQELGNPDFGTAFFVLRDGVWVGVTRLRGFQPDEASKLIEEGLSADQATRAAALTTQL
jgi:hypothetical protein